MVLLFPNWEFSHYETMLEIQKEALKEHNNGVSKEFQANDFKDIPPTKHSWLLWFALNLIYKLVSKLIAKQKSKEEPEKETTK